MDSGIRMFADDDELCTMMDSDLEHVVKTRGHAQVAAMAP
jgi:hypothetical protein